MKCTHSRSDLVLYYYEELDEPAMEAVEAQLVLCPSCRKELESVQSLGVIPRSPSVDIDEEALIAIRRATARRIAETKVDKSFAPWIGRPTLRWGLAVAVVATVFIWGRWSVNDNSSGEVLPPIAENARISELDFDAATGLVRISFDPAATDVAGSTVTGTLSDERIKTLLGQMLLDNQNPGGRLRVAKLLAGSTSMDVRPDASMIQSLESVLRNESNEGIRLQTLKALRKLLEGQDLSQSLKELLISILADEQNSALRIEALGLLTDSELASMERKRIMAFAELDNNPLIRRQARDAFGEEPTRRLESLD